MSCFASKKTLTEKAGEYEKRGSSLFLALALCLTLLPAAAFASGESETSAPHTHYLCGNGEACSYVGGHNETDKTTFATAIKQDNNGKVWVGGEPEEQSYQCALSEGTYYLATDLVLEHPITIAEDITLCLSGNSITINANENAFEVIDTISTTGSTFTLTDCKNSGKITHGTTTGGTKYLGNGVSLHQSCNFIMYGGSITGNNAASFGSSGVCVYGTMTVSGSVRITDNVNGGSKGNDGFYTGGTASNVCLIGRTTITIDGPLAEGSRIGVSLYSSRVFTSGWSTNMSDKTFSSYFTADDSSSTVALENGELKLSNPHTHSWTYTAGGATITATCINCAENNNTDFHGGSVTIAAPEAGAPTYDGSPKAAAMTVSNDWLGASANNIRITYKQGGTTLSAAPTNAGTYTAGITVGEGEGAVIASVEYTIATKELTDPTIEIASGSVYDGNAKTPNVTVKDGENTIDPSEYTVSYDNNVNAGENTATVTITDNANGNYTVWYKVAGDRNHSGTTPESVGVTIAKAKVEIPAADPTQFTYSGEEQTYTLAASGLYTVAGNVRKSAGTYTVTVTLKDAENYVWSDNTATAKTFDFAIAKAPVTVTGKDGSTVKTTTNPNGSSVTETKAADGSTATVKTDKHGQTTAETTLSSKAVETAKRNGEPVTAPVQVEATRDSDTAPTVKVELPRNSGDTKVEIPVTNVRPGTVAVIVHADGTEEIVKNSLPTEDGIRLTINGGATVKIVDNSKDFIDTRAHWAKDAIDFVSARGLVNGMNAVSYAPNASTTRAQLWTILARQNDADLTDGNTWFENAQNWAKAKGISDGADPNAAINRAQMVTMLWRAMGRPAAASGASFADIPADSYYAQAVAWAIENGITAGVGNGKFDPDAACTRGQIATFLYNHTARQGAL